MARNWNKFKLDELCHFWMRHKEKAPSSSIFRGAVAHSKIEITDDEKEELIDCLLHKLCDIKLKVDGEY